MIKKEYDVSIFNYLKNKPLCRLERNIKDNSISFYINDKIFAILSNNYSIEQIVLRLSPEHSKILRKKYKYILPSYDYMNRYHWNSIFLKAFSDDVIFYLIDLSYDLTIEKMNRKQKFKYDFYLDFNNKIEFAI